VFNIILLLPVLTRVLCFQASTYLCDDIVHVFVCLSSWKNVILSAVHLLMSTGKSHMLMSTGKSHIGLCSKVIVDV